MTNKTLSNIVTEATENIASAVNNVRKRYRKVPQGNPVNDIVYSAVENATDYVPNFTMPNGSPNVVKDVVEKVQGDVVDTATAGMSTELMLQGNNLQTANNVKKSGMLNWMWNHKGATAAMGIAGAWGISELRDEDD